MNAKTYNGHKNYNHWNVSLWIGNDEGLYHMARECIRMESGRQKAAEAMLELLAEQGITNTPDGAPYSVSSIKAAMVGL
jgi:hypothetical protein